MSDFNHFDEYGNATMVDISGKAVTQRVAIAQGLVYLEPETLTMLRVGTVKKGDVLGVARLAGIMAAKRTAELIPLCHPLSIDSIEISFEFNEETNAVKIIATCKISGRTGVEMEALTAVSVAALTIYDMCKSLDRSMCISDICLIHKSGGKSGEFEAKQ